ncbi:DUF4870 domain-containing protein [Haloferula chungangensis]|uniref:DUF4870 domain-containing protein n=1 Tax=Haloferula chungangensis TaxID=1048331 RepID=A0ABW2L1X5_9BACT
MNDESKGDEGVANHGDQSVGNGSDPASLEGNPNPYASSATPPSPGGVSINKEERNWALIAHLSSLSIFVGIPGFIGPLIVWLVKKDELPFASAQAKEALNFQITLFIYTVICIVLFITVVGALIAIPGLIALAIVEVVFTIIASIQAGEGKSYRYPMTIRLIA